MPNQMTRRETLKRGLAAAGVLATVPQWALPALAQGEEAVPFTDLPPNFNPNPNAPMRMLDIRTIDGPIISRDRFFALQHYGQPEVDAATYRLKVTGLVEKPSEFTIEDLRALPSVEVTAGYECSGNSPRAVQGLCSNGVWTGVRLRDLLTDLGVQSRAREVVFFGIDHGPEDVVFRQETFKVEQQFARSMSLENAMKPEPMLAYALNGEPLTRQQGFPVRFLMPGWYGVANVKWLAEVHLQEDRFVGKFQATWYRTMMGEVEPGIGTSDNVQWVETEVTRMNVKSVIARVTKKAGAHEVFGFVLNDGTPLRSVEVSIDNGPWRRATLDASNTKYSWKLFTYRWEGATPGEHTLVSRATDVNGVVQPVEADLAMKKTFLEANAQYPRKVMIS